MAPDEDQQSNPEVVPPDRGGQSPETPAHGSVAACPYCGVLLDPAPERGRLCPRCRQRIVVRRVDGRRVLLTEAALTVFDAQREREINERAWSIARRRWLSLARGVSAPGARIARLAAAPPSEAAVQASRELYLSSAERAVRAARREGRLEEIARIRREQAATLHRAAGFPVPPPAELVLLHREWSRTALRALAAFGKRVELVSAGCCETCARDDGRSFSIAAELRGHRLPHEGCPKGLCACDWYPLPDARVAKRRTRRRGARHESEPVGSAASIPDAGQPAVESGTTAGSAPIPAYRPEPPGPVAEREP